MPSSNTITSFYSFSAATVIRSAQVNSNFDAIRGHIIPVDPNTTTAASALTYDLGGAGHEWRGFFGQYLTLYQNTAGSVPAAPASGYLCIYPKSDGKTYTKNPAGVETVLGGGSLVVTGTRAAPSTITASGLVYSTTGGSRQQWYIIGDTTTGTDITANPQISAGSEDGQELMLVGRDDSRPVTFEDGTGLKLNGTWNAYADSTLHLRWDTSAWVEVGRNGL